jgi:hypothetical protein
VKERFDDLVAGAELSAAERERLRRVHELLVAVGPPPEVAPELQAPPSEEPLRLLPRRRRTALALLAATVGLVVFGSGYLIGSRAEPDAERVVTMTGVGPEQAARASLEILAQDDAGNWPMRLHVRGLEPSADRRDYYELWLTRDGELGEPCGRFTVHSGVTEVTLSVPYGLRGFDGWVVTRAGSEEPLLST